MYIKERSTIMISAISEAVIASSMISDKFLCEESMIKIKYSMIDQFDSSMILQKKKRDEPFRKRVKERSIIRKDRQQDSKKKHEAIKN